MSNFFKKAAVFTDLHLGLKSNSSTHNDDCLDFVKWFCKTAKEENCETCFFLGDYHNNRASINIVTLNYSLNALELLSETFSRVIFIPGNHDLYFRDKRDIQSAEWARHIPNIEIVNKFYSEGDISIVPWLVGDEHKRISKISAKYMFGHFELPHFYMNAMVQMPECGELRKEHMMQVEQVFSGHFHKRQTGGNITYIGNAFPHNYSDAGDDERGMMILDWGGIPEYKSWPGQPMYRVYQLSDVLLTPEKLLLPNMHCRINLDLDITYEEALFIKETFVTTYRLRELTLLPSRGEEFEQSTALGNIQFESIDTIVTTNLNNIKSDHYDPLLLLDIYRNL